MRATRSQHKRLRNDLNLLLSIFRLWCNSFDAFSKWCSFHSLLCVFHENASYHFVYSLIRRSRGIDVIKLRNRKFTDTVSAYKTRMQSKSRGNLRCERWACAFIPSLLFSSLRFTWNRWCVTINFIRFETSIYLSGSLTAITAVVIAVFVCRASRIHKRTLMRARGWIYKINTNNKNGFSF